MQYPIGDKEIDHRIMQMGIHPPGDERLRKRVLRELQHEREKRIDWENRGPPSIPMYLFDKSF